MEKVLLHTPVGVRDIYSKECAIKMTCENKINNLFNLYGFHNIQTPTFEFLIYLVKREDLLPLKICTSFLTGKETLLY